MHAPDNSKEGPLADMHWKCGGQLSGGEVYCYVNQIQPTAAPGTANEALAEEHQQTPCMTINIAMGLPNHTHTMHTLCKAC